MNPMMAGALVGALSEIPVYLRSKVVTKAELVLTEQVDRFSFIPAVLNPSYSGLSEHV